MANVFDPRWDEEYDFPPLSGRYALVGKQAGGERLGASVYEIPPGAAVSPMHVHHANEEMILVLAGTPTLRAPEGARELKPGDVVPCPRGPRGAHRIENHSQDPIRVLIGSTMVEPDVVEHLETDKIVASTGAEQNVTFRKEDAVDQFLGEMDELPRDSPSQ
jgi:uncharacterized cupin superfamily protein